MRLLRSHDLTFQSLDKVQTTAKYAILSHVWGKEEVTYEEIKNPPAGLHSKEGYHKIKAFAQRALANGYDYIWVDTCCIDKSSSAELSEAINSMFRLYREASVCYAFLADIPRYTDSPLWAKKFQASRWFTRGWTLQELIAPRSLEFYADDWTFVRTKRDLASIICVKTGIPCDVIMTGDFSNTSVAQRMSWSAGRNTSRIEDVAYCLMGLFNVNMPMLYGEGTRAFTRLQEEIIKISDDMSIFAWVSPEATFSAYRGLLACSPSAFAQCGDICWTRGATREPYQTTNKGIHISLALIARESKPEELIAPLQGVYNKQKMKLGIFLQKVGGEQYARIEPSQLAVLAGGTNSLSSCFVRQAIFMETADHSRAAGIFLRVDSTSLELLRVQPSRNWDEKANFFAFEAPVATQRPPKAVFALHLVHFSGSGIEITVDAGQPWRSALDLEGSWSTTPAVSQFTCKIHCRKALLPVVEVLMERGVFEGEAKIILSVTTFSDDDDDENLPLTFEIADTINPQSRQSIPRLADPRQLSDS